MSARRLLPITAVALLTSVLLAGCGGSVAGTAQDAPTPTPSTAPSATDEGPGPQEPGTNIKLEKPRARVTILPSSGSGNIPATGEIYSAKDARTIEGFPVPKGAKVKDPGAIEETWQFDIRTRTPHEVIEFYRQVLPQLGYRVRLDVTYTQAYEKVRWDLVFDGRVSGSMAIDPVHHTVFVVVNPPGQPAFAGDDQK